MNVAVLVLAAGKSRRTWPRNKLLTAGIGGRTMIGCVVDAALASQAQAVFVVLGHDGERIAAALAGRAVTFVQAPDFAAGLSASLCAGIAALPPTCQAALVCLGDMPLITPGLIDQLIDAYDSEAGHLIVLPSHGGRRGNPVLWDRRFFPDMMTLTGDKGARDLLIGHHRHVTEIAAPSAVLQDFDTPEALAGLPWGGGN